MQKFHLSCRLIGVLNREWFDDIMFYDNFHPKVRQIISLRKEGWPIRVIARKVRCSPYLVRKHIKTLRISYVAQQRIRKYIENNRNRFISKYAKESEINTPLVLDPILARVLGHLFFDGCVDKKVGNMYRIHYTNSSFKQVKYFSECVEKLFSIKPQKITIKKHKTKAYTVVFSSKRLREYFLKISHSYSTSDCVGVPKIIFDARDPEIKLEFLRAFWADEGSVYHKYLRIIGSSKSGKMIRDLQKLHKGFGVKTNICFSILKNDYTLAIYSLRDALLFQKLINFGDAIVTRGYNKGKLKKDVLKERIDNRGSSSTRENT